ncbi:hypothetical protein HY468_05035 [Candidatus Roizmanbacteria bacterium]|nr:hypothetical protein [Candidatus Roizmanbacteria bacterium]
MKSKSDINEKIVNKLLSGKAEKKYFGKQVVVMGGTAHILPESDEDSKKLVDQLEKKYPKQIPHLLFVPRPETYIL